MTNTACEASVGLVGSTNCNTSTAINVDENANAGGVYLPDPSKPKFGMRASRWARDIPMEKNSTTNTTTTTAATKNDDKNRNTMMIKIADDPNEQFEVVIGVCNVMGQPRHMELDIRIQRVVMVSQEEEDEDDNEHKMPQNNEVKEDTSTNNTERGKKKDTTTTISATSSSSSSSSLTFITDKLSSLTSSSIDKKKKDRDENDEEKKQDGSDRLEQHAQHHTHTGQEPVYIINAYMGGMFSRYHWYQPPPNPRSKTKTTINEYLQHKFWEKTNNKTRAPLAIDVNAKERIYGFYFKRYIFQQQQQQPQQPQPNNDEKSEPNQRSRRRRHILSAVEFQHMLKNFLRWGYVIGKTDIFKFQPFFFINKYSQDCTNNANNNCNDSHSELDNHKNRTKDASVDSKRSNDHENDRTEEEGEKEDEEEQPEDVIRYINCQGSVAMSALWWFHELDRLEDHRQQKDHNTKNKRGDTAITPSEEQHQNGSSNKYNNNNNNYNNNVELISDVLSPLVFPRVMVKQFRGVRIGHARWKKITQEESKQQLQDFLVGAGVQRAVTSTEFNQTNVTKILRKQQQQQTTMDDDENEYNDRRESIHA